MSSDSIVYIERTTIDTVKIPADTIYKSFPLTVFKTDTIIEYRTGRASSKVQSQSGVLYVTTKCDSLQELVLSTQSELKQLSQLTHTKEVVKTTEVPWWYKASLFLVVIYIIGFIIKTIFKTHLKLWKK